MIFLWVHYLGSGGRGKFHLKGDSFPLGPSCHDGLRSVGQGATVRFCELLMYLLLLCILGR